MNATKPKHETFLEQELEKARTGARVSVSRFMCGICHMQVCCVADATDVEILAYANEHNPSGTTNGWCHVVRETEGGVVGLAPCEAFVGRIHLLLAC